MENNDKYIIKEFQYALILLSLPKDEQIQKLSPGCITCELYNEYDSFLESYINNKELLENQKDKLLHIKNYMDSMDNDKYFECFNNSVLDSKEWEHVRELAKQAIDLLGIEEIKIPDFEETEPGIFKRE